MLKLNQIKIDGGTQQRDEICLATVAEYAEAYQNDAEMPPVAVYFDGAAYWLVDGFHRYHAAIKAGMTHIDADITNGTVREAILHSVGVNVTHGLKRSNADKRKAVQTLLNDAEWARWSSVQIAKVCGVGDDLVNSMRASRTETIYKNKYGQTAKMNVTSGNEGENSQPPEMKDKPEMSPPETKVRAAELPPDDCEIEQLRDSLDALSADHDRISDRLAVAAMDATDDEKRLAAVTMAELREENRLLQINLRAVTISRDQLINENSELKKQIKMMQRQLKKSNSPDKAI
jgi:hypothetical protein